MIKNCNYLFRPTQVLIETILQNCFKTKDVYLYDDDNQTGPMIIKNLEPIGHYCYETNTVKLNGDQIEHLEKINFDLKNALNFNQ